MDDSVQRVPIQVEPSFQPFWRKHIAQLGLGQIAPFLFPPQEIAHGDAIAALAQSSGDVGTNESRTSGNQDHMW